MSKVAAAGWVASLAVSPQRTAAGAVVMASASTDGSVRVFAKAFDGAQQFGREAPQFKSVGLLHRNRFAGTASVHGFNKGFGRRKVALHFKRVSHVGSHNNSPPLSGAPSFNG